MSLPEVILRLLLLSSLLCLSPAGGSEEGASRPYVSIIMGGRNDDWGGNFTARLHSSLSAIGVLSSIHNLHVEVGLSLESARLHSAHDRRILTILQLMQVIVVDYNPPADAPPISALPIPEMVPPSEVRIVTVPAAKHASLSSSPQWQGYGAQLYEYVAKNVGLRAATGDAVCANQMLSLLGDLRKRNPWDGLTRPLAVPGDFALFTNPDIILSPPLIGLLASQTLDARAFYTLPRTDLPSLPPQGLAAGAQVDAWCRASGAREGKELAPGDFLLASRCDHSCPHPPPVVAHMRRLASQASVERHWGLSRDGDKRGNRHACAISHARVGRARGPSWGGRAGVPSAARRFCGEGEGVEGAEGDERGEKLPR